MRKVLFIVFGILILLTSAIVAYHYLTEIDSKQANYSFLYRNYKFNEKEYMYINSTNRNIDILIPVDDFVSVDEEISEATFNNDGSKIWLLIETPQYATRPKVIEYDLESKAVKAIFSGDYEAGFSKYDEDISNIQCVPNSNLLSFISARTKFVTFDLNSKVRNNYDIDLLDYCWANDGKSIIYTDYEDSNIKQYDIKNKTCKTFLNSGREPIFSNNNRYIAYELDGYLVVKDLLNNKEYKHKLNLFLSEGHINSYRFTSDDKYIIFSQYDFTVIGGFSSSHVVLWDFINNKGKNIKSNISFFYDCK